jgi:hypothetical protein
MFTKEFIKISQILDQHGMHRQADDLLKIAQAKPASKPPVKPAVKPAAPTARQVTMMTPVEQNARYDHFLKKINSLQKGSNGMAKAEELIKVIENQYKNNYLDYSTYTKLLKDVEIRNRALNNSWSTLQNITPISPINPTAFPSMVNDTPIQGSGVGLLDGKKINIELASPLEGLTAAGEKALPNREDRNLPGLVKEWNSYLKTDSFKDSLEARIQEMKKYNQDTTKLEQLLSKTKTENGLQVGDFGNVSYQGTPLETTPSQIYGVEAKPLTSITGTPTTPAAAPAAPVANRS